MQPWTVTMQASTTWVKGCPGAPPASQEGLLAWRSKATFCQAPGRMRTSVEDAMTCSSCPCRRAQSCSQPAPSASAPAAAWHPFAGLC